MPHSLSPTPFHFLLLTNAPVARRSRLGGLRPYAVIDYLHDEIGCRGSIWVVADVCD